MIHDILRFHAMIAVLCTTILPSCGPQPSKEPVKAERIMFQWYDDMGGGAVSVGIDLTNQIATISRGGRQNGGFFVRTPKEGSPPRPGNYRIPAKLIDRHSNKNG